MDTVPLLILYAINPSVDNVDVVITRIKLLYDTSRIDSLPLQRIVGQGIKNSTNFLNNPMNL